LLLTFAPLEGQPLASGWRVASSVVAITNTILFDNPQTMRGRRLQQGGNENLEQKSEQSQLVLRMGPKYHDASMGSWRIRLDICEVYIQSDEHSMVRTSVLY
jgi:hypothetical protein